MWERFSTVRKHSSRVSDWALNSISRPGFHRFKRVIVTVFILLALFVPAIAMSQTQTTPSQPRSRTVQSPSIPNKQQPVTSEQEDPEVIRVETNLVNTTFTAVDKDRHFVTSLRPEDVRILENDVIQQVSLFERETNRPLSLALLIDTSESQRGVLAKEKRAASAFIDSVLRPSVDRAAVVSFTGVPKLEQGNTNDLRRLHQGIERVKIEFSPENARRLANGEDPLPKDVDPSGYTGIWDAMWMAIDEHLSKEPEKTRKAIILLSDGDDTSSTIKKQDVIDLALRREVVIYSIAVRDPDFPEGKLDSGALRKISDHTGGRAFFPQHPNDLPGAFAQIDQELRSQYLIAYSPTNKNHDGTFRRVRIEVVNPELKKQKLLLVYRDGYYATLGR